MELTRSQLLAFHDTYITLFNCSPKNDGEAVARVCHEAVNKLIPLLEQRLEEELSLVTPVQHWMPRDSKVINPECMACVWGDMTPGQREEYLIRSGAVRIEGTPFWRVNPLAPTST